MTETAEERGGAAAKGGKMKESTEKCIRHGRLNTTLRCKLLILSTDMEYEY